MAFILASASWRVPKQTLSIFQTNIYFVRDFNVSAPLFPLTTKYRPRGRKPEKPNKGPLHGREWRRRQGLPTVLEETGPLAELPDWSFADGRLGPVSKQQTVKIQEQQRLGRDILAGLEFINFAKARPQRLEDEENARRQAIYDSKLNPKGHLYKTKQ